MANSLLPVPLPLKGLNTLDPFVPFNSGYARELTNYSIYNGRLYLRPAVRNAVYNASVTSPVHWYDATTISSGGYAILTNGNIKKLSDNTGATSIGGAPGYNATRCKHVSLDLVIGCREPRDAAYPFTVRFSGTAATEFKTIGIVDEDIRAATSHKSRLYVADGDTLEYSGVAAILGDMAGSFSLAEFLDGQSILRIFSVTISPGKEAENVLVIFADGGRVLVYAGDYPASATWYLVGKFDMPIPISNVGFVERDGDIWVSTKEYAYWFRDLFSGDAQTAYANSPTRAIENIWQGTFWNRSHLQEEVSHSFYEPRLDAIISQASEKTTGPNNFGLIADYFNSAMWFVYFRKYQAWAVWFTPPCYAPVLEASDILYGTSETGELVKLVHGSAIDQYNGVSQTISVEGTWKTPYVFSQMGKGHKVNGVRVFFENTLSGYFEKIRTVFDYSDFNAVLGWYPQSNAYSPLTNPGSYQDSQLDMDAKSYNQYQALAGATGVGGGFSLQFTQKPKASSDATQTQSIYAATCYVEEGGDLF